MRMVSRGRNGGETELIGTYSDRKFYRQSEMNQHLRKRNGFVPMGTGEQSEVHVEAVGHSRRLF